MLVAQIAETPAARIVPRSDLEIRGLIRRKLMEGVLCEDIALLSLELEGLGER